MKAYFLKLYQYNDWANTHLLTLLENNGVNDAYVIRLYCHLLNAQIIWYSRLVSYPHSYQVWEVHAFEKMRQIAQESQSLWLPYLEQAPEEEFYRLFSYANSFGDAFENTVQDCLAHVVNHSTYHRAQIAKAIKDMGITPLNTDYITYCRLKAE